MFLYDTLNGSLSWDADGGATVSFFRIQNPNADDSGLLGRGVAARHSVSLTACNCMTLWQCTSITMFV